MPAPPSHPKYETRGTTNRTKNTEMEIVGSVTQIAKTTKKIGIDSPQRAQPHGGMHPDRPRQAGIPFPMSVRPDSLQFMS